MTTIPKREAALVTDSKRGTIDIYLPKVDQLSEVMVFLATCAMRYSSDPAFVVEQLAWAEQHMSGGRVQ